MEDRKGVESQERREGPNGAHVCGEDPHIAGGLWGTHTAHVRGTRAERTANIHAIDQTREVSKLSCWLKADALQNIEPIAVTLDVSRFSGRLKATADANMEPILVTLDVSRLSGWLKADADQNMLLMSVTREVSQLEMSELKLRKK